MSAAGRAQCARPRAADVAGGSRRGPRIGGEPAAPRGIRRGVSLENQPLPAPEYVLLVFPMRPLGVVEQKHVVMPGANVAAAMRGPRLCRIAGVAKFGVVALTAIGADDFQHVFIACKSIVPIRIHRARCRARIDRARDGARADAPRHARSYGRSTSPWRASP